MRLHSASTRNGVSLRSRRAYALGRRSVAIDLRPAQQMQMLSDFLESNFPSTRARAGLADRGSYLATLPDIEIATTPMLKTAIDTLCFCTYWGKDRRPAAGAALTDLVRCSAVLSDNCYEQKKWRHFIYRAKGSHHQYYATVPV